MARKISNIQLVEVYKKKACNISSTCEAVNITRKTFYSWRNSDKELDESLKEVEESLLDFAESRLMSHIQAGDTTCLIFYLKTKGKKRGYVERVEQEVSVNPFMELMKKANSSDE